ncbi:MAG: hypothetical protein ACE5J9_06280 [Methanosarcinales archaeon]
MRECDKPEKNIKEIYLERFPNSNPDSELLSLIGIDEYIRIEDEKKELIDVIEKIYNKS